MKKISGKLIHHQQMRLGIVALSVTILGQHLQTATNEAGEFLAPQFVRHHLSNALDVVAAAPAINLTQADLSKKFNLESISRPYLAAATAFLAGVGYEIYTALEPGRSFDFMDTEIYLLSAMAYCGITNIQTNNALQKQQQKPPL